MVVREALGGWVSLQGGFARLDPDVTDSRHRAQSAAAISTWWDAHIREGHTPESANMLLALTLPAPVLNAMTRSDDRLRGRRVRLECLTANTRCGCPPSVGRR